MQSLLASFIPGGVAAVLESAPACYHRGMKGQVRNLSATAAVRRSITLPAALALEVERVARAKHLTLSGALAALAQRGLEAEAATSEALDASYVRFMSTADHETKVAAGKDLIRAVFGKDAIAEDSVR